jgi:hypothetical protein
VGVVEINTTPHGGLYIHLTINEILNLVIGLEDVKFYRLRTRQNWLLALESIGTLTGTDTLFPFPDVDTTSLHSFKSVEESTETLTPFPARTSNSNCLASFAGAISLREVRCDASVLI